MARILVIEDDEFQQEILQRAIGKDIGHIVVVVSSTTEALKRLLKNEEFDIFWVDKNLLPGDLSGIEFISILRKMNIHKPVVVNTGFPNQKDLLELMGLDVRVIIQKPARSSLMKKAIKVALQMGKGNTINLTKDCGDEDVIRHLFQRDPNMGGGSFEVISIQNPNDLSVCISIQAGGCAIGCGFCVTGHISGSKIINLTFADLRNSIKITEIMRGYEKKPVTVLFQGMGEPLYNLDTVMNFMEASSKRRKFRLSTAFPSVKLFRKFREMVRNSEKIRSQLEQVQISVHFPNDELRKKHMPFAGNVLIKEILSEAELFFAETGIEVCFNYAVFQGINDSEEILWQWVELLNGKNIILRPTSANPFRAYRPVSRERMDEIRIFLVKGYVNCKEVFFSRGIKNEAACGKLAAKIRIGRKK